MQKAINANTWHDGLNSIVDIEATAAEFRAQQTATRGAARLFPFLTFTQLDHATGKLSTVRSVTPCAFEVLPIV